MDPITIGILAGLGKNLLVDQPAQQKQAQSMAIQQKYSPWTKQQPNWNALQGTPSPLMGALEGGLMGNQFRKDNPEMFKGPSEEESRWAYLQDQEPSDSFMNKWKMKNNGIPNYLGSSGVNS